MSTNSYMPIRFLKNGKIVHINEVDPNQTLLDYLRSPSGGTSCGTKEGCAQGDCGACTAVVAELAHDSTGDVPSLAFNAVNTCIRFTYQLDGCALWTVEDLAAEGQLHPVQQAMLESHASQCGFCTPGFVMSLFALYHQLQVRQANGDAAALRESPAQRREQVLEALSGNLCRCTGYRPIVDAGVSMFDYPTRSLDFAELTAQLQAIQPDDEMGAKSASVFRPKTLQALTQLRTQLPQAQLVAGATDVGIWVTKQHQQFAQVIDLTQVRELREIQVRQHNVEIGAAVPLEEAFAKLSQTRPQLKAFAKRFAGQPIRNTGTLGGNIANASPIGDSMPLLISLGAKLRLASQAKQREVALEDFFPDYRRTTLEAGEVISHILVPLPKAGEFSRIYKLSKRFEDDISAVCLAVNLELNAARDRIIFARIGVGGVAATPVRALQTEGLLRGHELNEQTIKQASACLSDEFSPLSDMRATDIYRRQALGNLLLRLWYEISSPNLLNQLESLVLEPLALET